MQYSPPAFFKQGPPAWVRLAFFAFISIVLLVVDSRMRALDAMREVVSVAVYPFQPAMMLPRDGIRHIAEFFEISSTGQQEAELLQRQRIEMAQVTTQAAQLAAENAQLRRLLGARARAQGAAVLGQGLVVARDPSTPRGGRGRDLAHDGPPSDATPISFEEGDRARPTDR